MRPTCNKISVQKSKSFLIDDDGHRRCGTSSFRCLFCNFSRETRIGAKEKYSGNQERPELKNSREFRKEAKAILVGKTGIKMRILLGKSRIAVNE